MSTATNNLYWNGERHAVLRAENISASWARGNGSHTRIDAVNRAFCIYYHAMQTINESVLDRHYSAMLQDLRDCATEGWGAGVYDMQDALYYCVEHSEDWDASRTTMYFGGTGKCYKRSLISDLPRPAANFMSAVDAKMPRLAAAMETYKRESTALVQMSQSSGEREWRQMRERLGAVKSAAENVSSHMWIMPAVVSAAVPFDSSARGAVQRVEAFADGATTWASRTLRVADVFSNIADGLEIYDASMRATHGNQGASMALAGLNYAVSFVPVLGTFYGAIISRIPGLVADWEQFISNYHNRFERASRGLDPSGGRRRTPVFRCEICGSSGGY